MFIFPDIVSLLSSAMLLWARFDSLTATDMFETGEWRMKAGEKEKKKGGGVVRERLHLDFIIFFFYDSTADELRHVPCSEKADLWSSRLPECVFFISQVSTNMHARTTAVSAAEANRSFIIIIIVFRRGADACRQKLLALDFVASSVWFLSAFPRAATDTLVVNIVPPISSRIEFTTCLVAVEQQVDDRVRRLSHAGKATLKGLAGNRMTGFPLRKRFHTFTYYSS